MTDFYTELAAVADELLAEYGQVCQLGTPGGTAYNPATSAKATTYDDSNITAAIFDFPQKYIDGTLIRVGDKRVLVSAVGLSATPAPGYRLTDAAGAVYFVVAARSVAPAGEAVLWVLQVRR